MAITQEISDLKANNLALELRLRSALKQNEQFERQLARTAVSRDQKMKNVCWENKS